jgi:hypothetical protein
VNFLLEVGHTGVKVQQHVVGTIIEVLISARPYSCQIWHIFLGSRFVGLLGAVSDSLGC